MWTFKSFRSIASMQRWVDANYSRVQWVRVFVNNKPYCLEYKPLRMIG